MPSKNLAESALQTVPRRGSSNSTSNGETQTGIAGVVFTYDETKSTRPDTPTLPKNECKLLLAPESGAWWKALTDDPYEVAAQGEAAGSGVPCLCLKRASRIRFSATWLAANSGVVPSLRAVAKISLSAV